MRINEPHLAQAGITVYVAHLKEKACQAQIKVFSETTGPAVMLAAGMLRIGFSDPSVDYALILRATKQVDEVKQIAGRVMRYQPDKIGYVLGFKDVNTELAVLCDEKALSRANKEYLIQSGRRVQAK